MCCAPIASRPCFDTFLTVHIPTFLYIFHEMFFITCLYAFFLLLYNYTPQMSVSVEMRSMKVGSACVRRYYGESALFAVV